MMIRGNNSDILLVYCPAVRLDMSCLLRPPPPQKTWTRLSCFIFLPPLIILRPAPAYVTVGSYNTLSKRKRGAVDNIYLTLTRVSRSGAGGSIGAAGIYSVWYTAIYLSD
ncbi:hypothetical protein F4778DRAFT_272906 [Xylariomycetidae sp. FL2044]|nr:hypothetical protein F4778DRAFT_272906 [Xylariomycetidae sp. FL2044]